MNYLLGTDQISRLHYGGQVLAVHLARVQADTGSEPARSWTFTDAAGHQHAYGTEEDPFPTLVRVSDGWADPPDYGEDGDDEFERYHLACKSCGEVIWPSEHGPGTTLLPAGITYTLDGERVPLEEARQFAAQIRDHDAGRWDYLRPWLRRMNLIAHPRRIGQAG